MQYRYTTMRKLVDDLNGYRNAYYNKNLSLITDKEYDDLFDLLQRLENDSRIIYPDSPTQTVGYDVQSKLAKVKHSHPMLSLSKTKSLEDIKKFSENRDLVAMLKMDGLTCSVHYDINGNFVSAETRGNGEIGEDITLNAKQIFNLPKRIPPTGKSWTIDGEVIIDQTTFNAINAALPDEEKYSHPRNLASGTIRQLDTKVTAERKPMFVAWRVIEGLDDMEGTPFASALEFIQSLGFTVVPYIPVYSSSPYDFAAISDLESVCNRLVSESKMLGYPIDGLVWTYNDVKYGNSLGMTGHHPNHSVAYKFYDDTYETELLDIQWSTSRTGQVNPVAIFKPVEIDGATVEKATLHNLSYIKALQLGIGDTITVYKANAIIPKVDDNLTRSDTYILPINCPCCGKKLEVRKDGIAEMLYCKNADCAARKLSQFSHFVSKPAMNIEGLSDSTLGKFINCGYLHTYTDIYKLNCYQEQLEAMEGFGKKSYQKLWKAIESSRKIKLENLIVALGIPLIGKTAAKTISKYFKGDWAAFCEAVTSGMDFAVLDDFGEAMNQALYDFAENLNHHYEEQLYYKLFEELEFIKEEVVEISNDFINGKTFCVTGAFVTKKRSEIEKIITDRGGKLSGSVSKKTSYLLTNDGNSGSSKSVKAKELNIPIMSEVEFLAKVGL